MHVTEAKRATDRTKIFTLGKASMIYSETRLTYLIDPVFSLQARNVLYSHYPISCKILYVHGMNKDKNEETLTRYFHYHYCGKH